MEDGKIDVNEAGKYIELNEITTLSKRKEILKIWNRIISKIDDKKYLIPYYQKIVDNNQIINGYEVFGRLRSLNDKLYNPNEFIPVLKDSGLYNEATNFLFNETFNKNKTLDLNFFINVDHTNLSSISVIENILEKINNTMIPNMSKFILETNYNSKYFIEDILLAKKHNLAISLDNFDGSVLALQRIKKHNLKIDYVKTYRDFIIGFSNNEEWVDAYMTILQELNSKIIITNIENKEIFEKLKNRYGKIISYYQGYYFGKPLETVEVL
jgi:EAL domain-containing protein (putative c-di-GMP-specific phosphodiesterase class I)